MITEPFVAARNHYAKGEHGISVRSVERMCRSSYFYFMMWLSLRSVICYRNQIRNQISSISITMQRIAIFPVFIRGMAMGFSFGWLLESNYCLVWGNCKTREKANELLKREYPKAEIINLAQMNDCWSRYNKPSESTATNVS